jgi:hypothetical protein
MYAAYFAQQHVCSGVTYAPVLVSCVHFQVFNEQGSPRRVGGLFRLIIIALYLMNLYIGGKFELGR